MATMELGRRYKESSTKHQPKITSSASVFELMQPLLGSLDHEEFWVLYLNNSNKVLTKIQLSKGGITATVVDTRLLFKKALEVAPTPSRCWPLAACDSNWQTPCRIGQPSRPLCC